MFLIFVLFNNKKGHHGAHHLYPELHWSKLPAVSQREIVPYQHPNLRQQNLLGYMFVAYVYPAHRLMYNGGRRKFARPADAPDVDWIRIPKEMDPDDFPQGYVSSLKYIGSLLVLFVCKSVSPLWSPTTELI